MKLKNILIAIVLTFIIFLSLRLKYEDRHDIDNGYIINKTIKVGVYEYNPCYYINNNGEIEGYYNDVLKILSNYTGLKYQYYKYSFKQVLENLESGKIDIVIGLNKTDKREAKFIYSQKAIGTERYGLYSNKNVKYADLDSIKNLELGVVKEGTNGKWIKEYLNYNNVSVNIKEFEEQSELMRAFNQKDIDLSIQPIHKNNKGTLSYEFLTGQVYIVANKSNDDIVKLIDETIDSNINSITRKLEKAYKMHFGYNNKDKHKFLYILTIILIFISIISLIKIFQPIIKMKKIQNKVRNRIKNNDYLLYYQPIYNPQNDNIVAFEALLRLKSKKGVVLPPSEFIPEIEKNNMNFDISIWVFEKIIKDYQKIKDTYGIRYDTYISMNVSINDIMEERFIDKIKEIRGKYNSYEYKICLEIIERVKVEDISKLNTSVSKLKNLGLLIAIDDFGMEYSNLDLLEKIDFDIIKLDKYFIDDHSKSVVKKNILKFIADLTKRLDRSLVIEGVETKTQKDVVKDIGNDKVYAQDYYYSKPISIE